jgi:hypothetical protein
MDQNGASQADGASLFSDSVIDAERLLEYASTQGIVLDQNIVDTIVDAKQFLGKDATDPGSFPLQKQFWSALSKLSLATKPATLESLRYSAMLEQSRLAKIVSWVARREPRTRSTIDVAMGRARWYVLIGLIFVAIFQLYFQVGNSFVADYHTARAEYVKNEQTIAENENQPGPTDKPPSATAAKRNTIAAEALKTMSITNQLLKEKIGRKIALVQSLLIWVRNWPEDEFYLAQKAIETMEGVITVLGDFVLPILWGFLGAALYVTRTLAEDIKTRVFSRDRIINYRLRYYMGAVAGFIAVKFFVPILGTTSIAAITPPALALLVGYSVEVLFTVFDKLIITFSTK